jgi:hypothetical protein
MELPVQFENAQKRRLALRDSLTTLETALAMAASSPAWRSTVTRALVEVRDAIQAHVDEVEAKDGLLPQLVADAPRLSNLVRIIERDHRRLLRICDEIISMSSGADPQEIRSMARDLMGDLVDHRQQGADLVYAAYTEDIGGQG